MMKNIKLYTHILFTFITLQTYGMNLFVQTPNNGTISLDVEPSDSGENIKNKIFDQISIPVINQVISWNGTTIQDGQTLADFGIVNNSTIVLTVTTTTQVPEKMSYQSVVRNAANQLVINQNVGVKFSILKSSATGAVVYAETQNSTTNSNGLFTTNIGSGTVISGSMASINWANDVYFIKSEIDLAGGSNYTITGTQQLLSVPYALNAKNGIPNGGTANQVLAKVDATDFNTAWVTPSAGGSAYPNVELHIINNVTQSITSLGNGTTANLITFSGSNSANASLTGGNTWSGNTFTVGATGAGWYQINAQILGTGTDGVSTSAVGIPFYMDLNNTVGGTMSSAILYRSNYSTNTNTIHLRNYNTMNTLVYLSAGNTLRFYGISASNSVTGNTSSNGSTFLNIVRIK